ncbi:MAG: domain containing protein, partial [Solirubrobacterales bacterium]|nr:domain containing protein [Solirubrobacterales bacterium]
MVAIVVAMLAVGAADASAAGKIVYRDPPSYKGVKTAPKTVAAPVPKAPAPVTLSSAGSSPDVLVDEAGTAHVVWNEDRGDAADVVVYCRMPRGASACDSRVELRSEIPDSDPNARYDVGTNPKIVRLGDQLIVFSKRYPIVRDKPDGASSSTVIAWASGDGGTIWTQTPKVVGKNNLGQMVVVGSEDDPTILNLGVDPLCDAPGPAGLCLQAYKSGEYAAAEGNLSSKADENYYPQLVLDEHGLPVMAASDLAYNTFIRRWKGTGSPLDATQWTAPTTVPADQSSIAGGPAGVYLMGKPQSGFGPYSVGRLNAVGDTYEPAKTRTVSAATDNVLGQLFQGPDGRLFAAWEQRDKGLLLKATAGPPGATPSFGAARTVATGGGNGQVALSATEDGGGFIAYNHTGGVVGEGEIQAGGFGTQLKTDKPGIADLAGGGVVPGGAGTGGACDELSFGAFTAEAVGGCLLKGKGQRSQEYVTGGEINLWGVRIIPEAGVKIVIDPKSLQLDTTGVVRVVVTAPEPVGDVLLFKGELHRDLSKVLPGTDLFEFGTGDAAKSILGFDIAGGINVRLQRDGVHIPLDLALPPAFGGFQAHAEFVADKDAGLHVDSVHLHVGSVPLGFLLINHIDLDYRGGDDLWTGDGSATVPAGGTLDLSAQFAMGAFKSAAFSFKPGTPIPVGPFVYLLQFGGGLSLEPTTIDANATLGVGAAVNGSSPVEVHGDLTMIFPDRGPGDFRLKGSVSLFFIQVGDGYLRFQTDGYAEFGGHAGFTLGPLSLDANADGFVDATTGAYGAAIQGAVKLCADIELTEVCASAGAATALNNTGFAACATFLGESGGLEYPWADFDPAAFVNPFLAAESIIGHLKFPCSTSTYHTPPPRPATRQAHAAQAAGGTAVEVEAGLPSKTILLKGGGGAPRVSVSGPGGSFTTEKSSDAGMVIAPKNVDAAFVVLKKPQAGVWTIVPEPGSPAITQTLVSEGYTPATVAAHVDGRGRRRAIGYRIGHLGHGQRVQFLEEGAFGTKVIGTVAKAQGTLRYAVADAKGGRRNVYALVEHDGI